LFVKKYHLDLVFFLSISPIKIGAFDFEKKCEELATRTDGFSGREIAKLLAACQVRLIKISFFFSSSFVVFSVLF